MTTEILARPGLPLAGQILALRFRAVASGYLSRFPEARADLDGLAPLGEPDAATQYDIAIARCLCSDCDAGLVALRAAITADATLRARAQTDRDLDPLRRYPGFADLLALPAEAAPVGPLPTAAPVPPKE